MFEFIAAIIAYFAISEGFWWYRLRKKLKIKPPIMKGAEPYFVKQGSTGVLLVHGFSGTPDDFRALKKYLIRKKFTVSAPLLPGHGTIPEDLASKRAKHWVGAVEAALRDLKRKTKHVYIVGNSFGANLSVLLATKYKVDGVVLMGMPYWMKYQRTAEVIKFFIPLMFRFKRFKWKKYPTKKGKEIAKTRLHYRFLPMNCLPSFYKIIRQSRRALKRLTTSVLVLESTTDHFLSKDNGKRIFANIGSEHKHWVKVPGGYHSLLADKQWCDVVAKEIIEFIICEKPSKGAVKARFMVRKK